MSVWRSPVFYFGVLLATAVFLALVAPFLINWDRYKDQLEEYGQQLTGRDVVIAGDVDVRLFPWPRLTATNLIVANEAGFNDAPLLAADAMTTRFSLAGLFNGTLQVEEIEFDAPQLNLVRSPEGTMNWTMRPADRLQGLLSRVKLDRITIRNGGIWFEDKVRKQGSSLTAVNATLSAQALEGPWRLTGTGAWRDTNLNLAFTSGAYKPEEGLRMALTATPEDNELPVFAIDGTWRGEEMRGGINLSGQEGGSGKGSIQDKLRPLALQAQYLLTPNAVQFSAIKIAPVDEKDSGTLIEGKASVDLTSGAKADIALSAPRINLDAVLGAGSLARWRTGGLLAITNSIFSELPEAVEAKFSLDVALLAAGGETLNDVSLSGTAERQAIRITNATAQLPGRTRAKFDGIIFPNPGGAELGGSLALDSSDLRNFTNWLLPGVRGVVTDYWPGSRGRLKLQGGIKWSPAQLALDAADYELDGLPGKANLVWRFGDVPLVDVALDAGDLNLDAYLRGSKTPLVSVNPLRLMALLPTVLDLGQVVEQHVVLKAGNLSLNGASAQAVQADYRVSPSGLEVKALNFTTAGGAAVRGEGLVINGTDGPVGEVNLSLKADDVADVLKLAGAGPVSAAWQDLLGATDANLTLAMDAEQSGPRINIKGHGSSGQLTFTADTTLRDLERKQGALASGTFDIATPEASPMLRLLGLPAAGVTGPLQGKAVLEGDETAGFVAQLSAKLLGTEFSYNGKINPDADFWGVDGAVEMNAQSLAPWISATGLSGLASNMEPVHWQGRLYAAGGGMALEQDGAATAGGEFKAEVSLDSNRAVNADIEAGALSLKQVLAWTFMPWRGGEPDAQDSFSSESWPISEGQIFLKPRALEIGLGRPVQEAVIGIDISPKGREISVKAPGKVIDVALAVKSEGASFNLTGHGRVAIDLPTAIATEAKTAIASGTMIVEGDVSAMGRSPAAALQAMEGKGVFWLDGSSLSAISANGFGQAITAATTPAQLSNALLALERPPGTSLPAQTGAVTIHEGTATTAAITMRNSEENISVLPQLDLLTGDLSIKAAVQSGLRTDLPPVTFTFSGAPQALKLRKGSAALAAKLGYELMSREMERLEKLQQEEQAILQREEQQRLEDQKRFDDYQLQRAELRQRQRELSFQADERKRIAAETEQELRKAIAAGDAINKLELAQRMRETATRRRLAEPLPSSQPPAQVPVQTDVLPQP